MCRSWRNRGEVAIVLMLALAASARAQTTGTIVPSVTIAPPDPAAVDAATAGDELLQLETVVNDRSTGLVAAFMRHPDGSISSSRDELRQIGVRVPGDMAQRLLEVPLADLPGVSYRYDEEDQRIYLMVSPEALAPTVIDGRGATPAVSAARSPLGGLVNYTLFASAQSGQGVTHFDGVSGQFETRLFGPFGLVENSVVGRLGQGEAGGPGLVRLDSSYTWENPHRLLTVQAGDLISGGFDWTRPIRMAGLQIRRDFGLRPDLITIPMPTLGGSAAAPSTLDLYVNKVRTLSAAVPQGPYEIDHPPVMIGGGQAQMVLRDALGRETVSTSSFYVSPNLLKPGLSDYSAEIGFARRNYAVLSDDYDPAFAWSASYRRGITDGLTLQGHVEGVDGLVSAGGGGVFTLGRFGLMSLAGSGSTWNGRSGALVEASFESRLPFLTVMLRTQRTFGDYEDQASVTAPGGVQRINGANIYAQPQEVDQASVSTPLPWRGSSIGATFIETRRTDLEHSRIVGLSYTQQFGKLALFASASTDLQQAGSAAVFVGLSMPLGNRTDVSAGVTRDGTGWAGYAEATRQGGQLPGTFGGQVRVSDGDKPQVQAIAQYGASFAHFEGTALYSQGIYSGTALMEGAVSFLGSGLHASQRLDNAFALVDVGAPGVTILSENRRIGVTNRGGQLLVPGLQPFTANHIALDPDNLPLDAMVDSTEAIATPFSRSAAYVDLRARTQVHAALLQVTDPRDQAIELGSLAQLVGSEQTSTVGFDGQVYVENLKPDNDVVVTTPDGGHCKIHFRYQPRPGEQVHIGPLVCMPT